MNLNKKFMNWTTAFAMDIDPNILQKQSTRELIWTNQQIELAGAATKDKL